MSSFPLSSVMRTLLVANVLVASGAIAAEVTESRATKSAARAASGADAASASTASAVMATSAAKASEVMAAKPRQVELKEEVVESSRAAKKAPKSNPVPPDSIELLRDRLAAKLGNPNAAEPANARELRVTARAADVAAAMRREAGAAAAAASGAMAAKPRAASRPASAPVAMPSRWDYEGAGAPEHWSQIKPEYAKCSTGTRQSPIDIRDGIKVQLDPVQFDYKPSGFNVIDDGHTIQVNVGPGNSIEVMGRRYDLQQFHFHRPSEERINGRQFDMVTHLVHKDMEGRIAIVAVLLDRGSAHPVVQSVWNNLPLEKGDTVAARGAIDLSSLLPQDRSYYTYMGSMTTPPCSEGVLWMVMKTPMPISPEQVGIFSRLYPMNARPIQASAGRLIKESQ